MNTSLPVDGKYGKSAEEFCHLCLMYGQRTSIVR
jgi:hypothetical protein